MEFYLDLASKTQNIPVTSDVFSGIAISGDR
jgi:hypothetical protein